jgi:hypothetical protein
MNATGVLATYHGFNNVVLLRQVFGMLASENTEGVSENPQIILIE